MKGFSKIDLAGVVSKNTKSHNMGRKKRNKKSLKIAAISIAVLVLFIIFGIILPIQGLTKQAKITMDQAKLAGNAIKQQNISLASDELVKTKTELTKLHGNLRGVFYLGFIPIASWYYSDADHLVKAGLMGIDASQVAVDALKPYADLLGLKGGHSFSGGSAQDRIQTAVLTMGKITPKIDEISSKISDVQTEIDKVDPNHYPAFGPGKKIRDQLNQAKLLVDESATFMKQAKPLIKVLPSVLGEPKEQKYLILFQNDKERRPTGGFLTAYAMFRIDRGIMHVDSSNDIYTLDGTIANKPIAPRPLLQYLPKVPQLNLRDTNLSPDFIESMQLFRQMYEKAGGYQKVDGIIAIDTHVLVAAMNILGDMEIGGTKFTTQEDPRCKCPQVIYELEAQADRPVNYVRADRKSVIGDLMYAIMNKAFSSSPKLYWGPLFQTFIAESAQKHVLFDLYNQDAQTGIESLNAAGRIAKDIKGDYLHVNDANFGGAKANMYTSESIDQQYEVASDGSITKSVTINYKNPFPPSDCNLEHGNLCLNAPLRTWLRIYVPKGSKLVSSKGSEVKVTTYDELGKTVFEGFIIPKPLGSAKVTFTYTLPFKLEGSTLPLLVQKQAGVDKEDMTIISGGKTLETFPLIEDKKLNLTIR